METTIIILSLLSLFQFISNLLLLSNIKKLKKDKEEKEVMMQILPGDKVTFEQGLIWQKKHILFCIL
jgi:preprotein translocase subunit YajC